VATSTFSKGSAGGIDIVADSMLIDARGVSGPVGGILSRALNEEKYGTSEGNAGSIRIQVKDDLSIFRSEISSSTRSEGDAGTVEVAAGTLLLDEQAGIFSQTFPGHFLVSRYGDAGAVTVRVADSLSVLGGSAIASNTVTDGIGGSVSVDARTLLVAGTSSAISAAAEAGSSGQTGDVVVSASERLTIADAGTLAIFNDADVSDPGVLKRTKLSVIAPIIEVMDARIRADSTHNVDASNIEISFTERLVLDPSRITTSAKDGDGGDIKITGTGLFWLDHSQITTSTKSGNGGNIAVGAGILLLETGFIQANTEAERAQGGNVAINVGALVASGPVQVGGDKPVAFDATATGLNVIQAAAPDGVSGHVVVATPALDVAGDLSRLSAALLDPAPLMNDLCRRGTGSALTPIGRGGLRPTALGLIRPARL
jgi:hypothetical protein